ncbi:hypothetical protein HOO54_17115 [Bacillus sp. WMMC1349]|uniref:L-2-amino-thiazoline-4-carboxylic acid hydrolase n=1 Tax=Bacillus sp. WMMC1349 TaxID=2736254 RepID=UPI0015538243|nr:L-2-amino-thiazoline-4-carboxylic acid hydrolase [Bacillus sp. WMMC1349]NPC93888.1 hypothetical protein [Bacillus sp. WMMC1349]
MKKATYDKAKLMKSFDKYFNLAEQRLQNKYGKTEARNITAQVRNEFETLIPRIPYIGGRKNMFTPVMIINGWIIALYRVIKAKGGTVEDVIQISHEASDDFFKSLSPWVAKIIGQLVFTKLSIHYMQKQAKRSQKKIYTEDFVYTCSINQKAHETEVELEFTECAVQKYYEAEGAEELKPYCNFFDPIYSKRFGMGVQAEHTFGLGCETCKLNYNNRRETKTPANLVDIIKR